MSPWGAGQRRPCCTEGRGQIPPNHPVMSPMMALTFLASMASSAAAALELLFQTGQGMGLHGGILFPCIINGCHAQLCGQSQAEPGPTQRHHVQEAEPCWARSQRDHGTQVGTWTHSHHWHAPGSKRDIFASRGQEMRDLGLS